MIDDHVHLRDWEEDYKETIRHGLAVAERAGLSAVFDMPNTDPAVTSRGLVKLRLREARNFYSPVFYGLFVGLTSEPSQIEEAVVCVRDYFPKSGDRVGVVGLKMFAGKSVGNLGVIEPERQLIVYKELGKLGYEGVLVVHCEKESEMKPELWNPEKPITHCYARPENSEIESIRDQIRFAREAGYRGKLHIAHVSSPTSVRLVQEAKQNLNISCGVTPHHLLLDNSLMDEEKGVLYKVNPPLRDSETRHDLFKCFVRGEIDVLESDHAPHSIDDKLKKYMSGIPGLPWWQDIIGILKLRGVSKDLIERVSHDNVNEIFGLNIPRIDRSAKIIEGNDKDFYAFDPYAHLMSK